MEGFAIFAAIAALVISIYLYKAGVKLGEGPLGGVCAGIADHFDLPPNAVRIGFLILAFMGVGLVTYLICYFVLSEG